MTETSTPPATADLIDRLVGLDASSPAFQARHERAKVAAATQASYEALLDPGLAGLGLDERLLVALLACRLTPCPVLADHYRERLVAIGVDPARIAAADAGRADSGAGPRLQAILAFTRTLIERPLDGDRAALQALLDAGLSTAAVVALAQLIAFLSYQTRLVAGLQAMQVAAGARAAQAPEAADGAARAAAPGALRPVVAPGALRPVVEAHGFTNRTVGWKAWLDVVDLDRATPLQLAVLEESHPQARSSDYYRTLVHQPEILRQRSAAFNAIMYAPGGLPRAERELASTVVSRINGCVYCASVHAQRFEQLAKRNDTIAQVFDDPASAGTSARERAIVALSIALTADPGRIATGATGAVEALGASGLGALEILDLIHAVAIFAWANRLMLNLGEPVLPAP